MWMQTKLQIHMLCMSICKKESERRCEQINGLVHEKANRQKNKAKKTNNKYFKSMQGHQTLLQSPISVFL